MGARMNSSGRQEMAGGGWEWGSRERGQQEGRAAEREGSSGRGQKRERAGVREGSSERWEQRDGSSEGGHQ